MARLMSGDAAGQNEMEAAIMLQRDVGRGVQGVWGEVRGRMRSVYTIVGVQHESLSSRASPAFVFGVLPVTLHQAKGISMLAGI